MDKLVALLEILKTQMAELEKEIAVVAGIAAETETPGTEQEPEEVEADVESEDESEDLNVDEEEAENEADWE